jgi:hypothetical protein
MTPSTLRPLLLPALVVAACSASTAAPPPTSFRADRAWTHLEAMVALGPRPAGSEALDRAREYIAAELESCGLAPVTEAFRSDTPAGEIEFANVWADIGPEDAPLVVLVTHIDTKRFEWTFVGANDSAAGTAALLELARALAGHGGEREVTYRILFVDGEESIREEWTDPDNRYGSRHHVRRLQESGEIRRVRACVLLDLVGDADLRLSTESYSDTALREIFFDAARRIGLGKHVGGPRREIKDDHLSFMAANIPSVDLIDFEYGPNNAYWHDRRDTIENVSADSLGVVGRIVLAGLPALEDHVLGR